MKIQRFCIPIQLPGLNEYIAMCRKSKYLGAKMKRDATGMAAYFAREFGLAPVKEPCIVVMAFNEPNRRRDSDNVEFARKFVLDGLVSAGILENDSPGHVLASIPMTLYRGEKPYILVAILSGQKPELTDVLGDCRGPMLKYVGGEFLE